MAVRSVARLGVQKNRGSQYLGLVLCMFGALGVAALFRTQPTKEIAKVQSPVVVGEFDSLTIPVPASFVPSGTYVKDIQFKQIRFPRHQVPEGALQSVAAILEGVSLSALPANLPLFAENFSLKATARNPVIERIPPGMRAMTVRVDATSAVEGWAGSGSTVDVLLVEKDRTTVVAEKVKVLSAERSVSPVEGAAAPNVPSTVTLLVTQEQCLAINTAVPRGKLAFALRSTADEEGWGDTIYTADRLKGGSITSDVRPSISGYVSFRSEEGLDHNAFALANGKWVKTEVIPQGFFPSKER